MLLFSSYLVMSLFVALALRAEITVAKSVAINPIQTSAKLSD